ncbi:MAG: adenylosuccinate lyase [Pseudomonadota bacterium]
MSAYSSKIVKNFYGTEEMRQLFSDDSRIAHYVKIEVALAKAEAGLGIIPQEAYEAIVKNAPNFEVDWERLREEVEAVGYPVMPFLNQFTKVCGPAGEYLHWGSTTRDITDTTSVLMMRAGMEIIERDAKRARKALIALTEKHRDTVMIARTHGMHALPSTFGYRCAVWLAEVERQLDRLAAVRKGINYGQFGGAVGNLSALGDRGLEVQKAVMEELGLQVPAIAWFASRDNVADVVQTLSSLASTMASIGKTIVIMTRNEIGEAREPSPPGRGTSSAMPHKHNTVGSELVIVTAKIATNHATLVMESMVQDFERDYQGHYENVLLSQVFLLSHAAVSQMATILEGLQINTERMRKNIDLTQGLVMAESVMMQLAKKVGRHTGHHMVSDACEVAIHEGIHLREALHKSAEVTKHLSAAEIDQAMQPENYIGSTLQNIDNVLAASRKRGD